MIIAWKVKLSVEKSLTGKNFERIVSEDSVPQQQYLVTAKKTRKGANNPLESDAKSVIGRDVFMRRVREITRENIDRLTAELQSSASEKRGRREVTGEATRTRDRAR